MRIAWYHLNVFFAVTACGSTPTTSATPARAPLATHGSQQDGGASEQALLPRAAVRQPRLLARQDTAARPGFESRLYLIEVGAGASGELGPLSEPCLGYVIEGRLARSSEADLATAADAAGGFIAAPGERRRIDNGDTEQRLQYALIGVFPKNALLGATERPATPARPSDAVSPLARAATPSATPVREIKRTLLAQRDLVGSPGLESRLYLIEFPPAAASKLHLHTSPGVGYVLEGSFESSFGDGPLSVKRAGEPFVDLAGAPHRFRNADPVHPLRFVVGGTYRKDESLFQALSP
jgi:quercetin dioxygenase-like cupin family protein